MKVFLSYSYEDNPVAQKLRNYLLDQGINVFDDKNDITVGTSLASSINEAINSSDAVIFLISKNFDKSHFAHQEVSLAVSNRLRGNKVKLIPIVVEKNVDIPFFLKNYLYLDISGTHDFKSAMAQLILGLKAEQTTSVAQDLAAQAKNIEIEREFLTLRSMEHEAYKKLATMQLMIAMLISAIAASVGLLSWMAKIEYSNFEWLIAFLAGAIALWFFKKFGGSS